MVTLRGVHYPLPLPQRLHPAKEVRRTALESEARVHHARYFVGRHIIAVLNHSSIRSFQLMTWTCTCADTVDTGYITCIKLQNCRAYRSAPQNFRSGRHCGTLFSSDLAAHSVSNLKSRVLNSPATVLGVFAGSLSGGTVPRPSLLVRPRSTQCQQPQI